MPDRILVYGVTGSGKSTLAAQIATRTGLPLHLVDDLTYGPGWVQVSDDVQRERIAAICRGPRWILDTAYARWVELPLARAELVVALDYPRWLSLSRLLRRTVSRIVTRRPMCNGNVETLRHATSRESIIAWHFSSFSRKRARIREWVETSPGPRVVRLDSPHATRAWLASLGDDDRDKVQP